MQCSVGTQGTISVLSKNVKFKGEQFDFGIQSYDKMRIVFGFKEINCCG